MARKVLDCCERNRQGYRQRGCCEDSGISAGERGASTEGVRVLEEAPSRADIKPAGRLPEPGFTGRAGDGEAAGS
ncbi:unnamed protein product [Leptidea sinapis]|uniref:Uncharacterized protein n=1 Tax=Leptidea sinapis TaxID=189913 RepID=A0A5E4Q9M0_9NEOP|nr:unnamed protein product [Leptidea sinapis]